MAIYMLGERYLVLDTSKIKNAEKYTFEQVVANK
jgi:hypothetical protein